MTDTTDYTGLAQLLDSKGYTADTYQYKMASCIAFLRMEKPFLWT